MNVMTASKPTCPYCGVEESRDISCRAIWENFLALEFTDPAYGQVHFFTVAAYQIQHQGYSQAALAWIAEHLLRALQGEPVDRIRTAAQSAEDQRFRTEKIERQPQEPQLEPVNWRMTILDVYVHMQDAESYCLWIRRWAQAVYEDMQVWL